MPTSEDFGSNEDYGEAVEESKVDESLRETLYVEQMPGTSTRYNHNLMEDDYEEVPPKQEEKLPADIAAKFDALDALGLDLIDLNDTL